jgi:hypothetical protein
MTGEQQASMRPWSARRPQNFVLSGLLIVLGLALAWQGLSYIRSGVGGVIPYFILVLGPALAVYYTWYFVIRDFDAER